MNPLGVNLSFCVKRWVTPELWAPLVRERLGLSLVQLSLDLVDPMWPDDLLAEHAERLREATRANEIELHSAFIGLAHYTFNQLLHPDPRVRDYAEAWLVRAYRFAGMAGIRALGGPLGAVASRLDAVEPDAIAQDDYRELLARMHRLAAQAQAHGLAALYVEPTPMRREWPWTIAQAKSMSADLADSAVPWLYCLDWGHGTCEGLYGTDHGEMRPWLSALGPQVGAVHIQQTDYLLDRHWDFTVEGRVEPDAVAAMLAQEGLGDVPVFLEVFYPFERDDASVMAAVEASVARLRRTFA